MSALEILSLSLNALLVLACLFVAALSRRERFAEMASRQLLQQQIDAQLRENESLSHEYLECGTSIRAALKEIREDIDRNYRHTHAGHVLDLIAYEFELARGPIQPKAFLARQLVDAGGARFIVDGKLTFGAALAFAWQQHAQARRWADELLVVTRQVCGETDRAAWLAKTLALYERICGQRERAISSLAAVLELWRYLDLQHAVYSATKSES